MGRVELVEGEQLGHFRVVRAIGSGGFGTVWLARDVRLGRWVALKVLAAPAPAGIDEARAAARLAHPNIVAIHDVGEHAGRVYLALEYVEGVTLRERLDRGQLQLLEKLHLARELAAALEAAHLAGVAHLDLTPKNIIVGKDGRLRVIDFGLARVADERSVARIVGTPTYMAPEQWAGTPAPASDIWALGLILHELFAGFHPLERLAAEALDHRASDPSPLELGEITPPDLLAAVAACLARAPTARPSAATIVAVLSRLAVTQAVPTPEPPFRGLVAFDRESSVNFEGRGDEIAELVDALRGAPSVCVTGASGTGKSSLLHAGLAPHFKARGWTVVDVRPGRASLPCLAQALVDHGLSAAGETLDEGAPGRRLTIADWVSRWRREVSLCGMDLADAATASCTRLVVLVDPLEELETLRDPAERDLECEALARIAEDPQGPVRVVFAVRDDFLGRLAARLPAGVTLGRIYVLSSPGPAALRAVLERPVEAAGFRFEPGLAEAMIAAVRGEAAALSLLQVTAAALWERRDLSTRRLTRSAYDDLGGVAGALAAHADQALAAFPPDQLEAARSILLDLVAFDGTRRPRPRDELAGGEAPTAVVERLIAARLITIRRAPSGREEVELAHELLTQRWPTLGHWLDARRGEHASFEELVDAARRWAARGRRSEELWRGNVLASARRLLATRQPPDTVQAFVAAAQRRERRRRWQLRAALSMSLLAALAAALVLAAQRQQARDEARRARRYSAEAMLEAGWSSFAEGNFVEARAFLRSAVELDVTPLARALQWRLALEPMQARLVLPTVIEDAAWIDEDNVAVLGEDAVVRAVTISTGRIRALGRHRDKILGIATSPGHPAIASGSMDYAVMISPLDGAPARQLARHAAPVQALAWSESRSLLAAADSLGEIVIRDSRDGSEQWRFSAGVGISKLAFAGAHVAFVSVDGAVALVDSRGTRVALLDRGASDLCPEGRGGLLVSTDDGRLLTFAGSGRLVAEALVQSGRVVSIDRAADQTVTVGSDGVRRLTSAGSVLELPSEDQHLISTAALAPSGRLLAMTRGQELLVQRLDAPRLPPDTGFSGAVREVAFVLDDRVVIGGGDDGILRSFDVETGTAITSQATGHGRIRGIAASADGRSVLSTGDDGQVRRWRAEDLRGGELVGRHDAEAVDLAVGAGLVVSAGFDHTARVWGALGGPRVLAAGAPVWSVAVAATAGRILALTDDRRVLAWPITEPATHAERPELILHAERSIDDIVVLGDGRRVVVLGESPQLVIDLASGARSTFSTPHRVKGGDAAPGGTRVALVGAAGWGALVDVASGAHTDLGEHYLEFWNARSSRDGRKIATSGEDGLVGVWRASDGTFAWSESATAMGHGRRSSSTAIRAAPTVASKIGALEFLGHTDGLVTVDLGSRRVAAVRLHGAIVSLVRADHGLLARTATGASATFPIADLELDDCELLRRIEDGVAVVWRSGQVAVAPPRAPRRCDD